MNLKLGTGLPAGRPVPDAARFVEDLGFESAWAPDLIIGDGTPAPEAALTLAAAAAVTDRIGLGFGVLVVPLRPPAWLAAQIATLQDLSGGRVLLGAGSGGFPDSPFWRSLGVPADERGARTDTALRALPRLLAGEPTEVTPGAPPLTLAPAAVPPILAGGNSAAAMRRAVAFGGWFPSLITPEDLRPAVAKLRAMAEEAGRPMPEVTVGGHLFLGSAPGPREEFTRTLAGLHGIPYERAARIPMAARDAEGLAEVFAAYAEAGADRIVTGPDDVEPRAGLRTMIEARDLLGGAT